jgi:hypothetical protein
MFPVSFASFSAVPVLARARDSSAPQTDEEKKLKQRTGPVTLSKETEVDGITFPAGARLYFSNKKLDSVEVRGIRFLLSLSRYGQATQTMVPSCFVRGEADGEALIAFSGENVQRGMLERDRRINGIPFKSPCDVEFFESGRPESGVLSRDKKIGKYTFIGGRRIILDEKGLVTAGVLAAGAVIEGMGFL